LFAGPQGGDVGSKVFTQVGGNGLLTRPGLGLGDVDDKLLQIDVLTLNAQESPVLRIEVSSPILMNG
jgi:hypothetical protein